MPGYGQFCPVAKAMELLDERWTVLVVRELLAGSTHFNDLRRGVPKMSPTLLSKRLQTLTRAGVVERSEVDGRTIYTLTECGRELVSVVEALGAWSVRWMSDLVDRGPRPERVDVGHPPHDSPRLSGHGRGRCWRSDCRVHLRRLRRGG